MLTSASPGRGGGAGADRAKARYGVIDHRSGKSAALTEEALALARAAMRRLRHSTIIGIWQRSTLALPSRARTRRADSREL